MKIRSLGAVFLLLAGPVSAQPGLAPAAPSIPLSLALEAVQTSLAACSAKNSPAAVEVVDANGNLKAMLFADGARPGLIEFARRKAYTVFKKKVSSREFGKPLGNAMVANAPPIEGDPNLIAYAGGMPIMKNGAFLGALAVSGPGGQDQDEVCAAAGLDKIKDRL